MNRREVFKFFRNPAFADALVSGYVWINTLGACRRDEHAGDAGEAMETYESGLIVGNGDDPAARTVARRLGGLSLEGSTDITLSGNVSHRSLEDAYVLCLTERYAPEVMADKFGAFCVRVRKPRRFFDRVTSAMTNKLHLRGHALGPVSYRERHYFGLDSAPGPLGFVKSEQFAEELEVRCLWVPVDPTAIRGFLLEVPAIRTLCERVT
jgi:hypothetical protein